jgi:stage II sporulation protein GA (sporulation sigma-E factor processing peptidase)
VTVYLDVIWSLNLLFDSLLLYLTAIILKRKIVKWRIFLGGLLGSIIILLAVTPFQAYSGHPLTKLLFSIFMVLIAYGYKKFRFFFTGLITFYLTTFLVGGALIGTHYFVNFDFELSSSVMIASVKGFGDPISWLFVMLGFPIAWHFTKSNMDKIETVKIQYDQIVNVTIFLDELKLTCKGLVDSGNLLFDPISKSPVMFVSVTKLLNELPQPIIKLANNPEAILFGNESIPENIEGKMRIIPCKVVGKEQQLIIAIKPDQIIIERENESVVITKGLISFTMQDLSGEDSFQCIVHPKMLAGLSETSSTKVS